MKYCIILLAFCFGCGVDHTKYHPSDTWQNGKLGHWVAYDGHYKIPEYYHTGYDSIEIFDWGFNGTEINFCYPNFSDTVAEKKREKYREHSRFVSDSVSRWTMSHTFYGDSNNLSGNGSRKNYLHLGDSGNITLITQGGDTLIIDSKWPVKAPKI